MFESLTDKLQSVFDKLGRQGKLSENDVNVALREVRLALLEADVNFKVVKDFVEKVKVRAIGAEVMNSLTPAQQVVKDRQCLGIAPRIEQIHRFAELALGVLGG